MCIHKIRILYSRSNCFRSYIFILFKSASCRAENLGERENIRLRQSSVPWRRKSARICSHKSQKPRFGITAENTVGFYWFGDLRQYVQIDTVVSIWSLTSLGPRLKLIYCNGFINSFTRRRQGFRSAHFNLQYLNIAHIFQLTTDRL